MSGSTQRASLRAIERVDPGVALTDTLWTLFPGGNLSPTDPTNVVTIGTTTHVGTEKLRVVGNTLMEGQLFVENAAPTANLGTEQLTVVQAVPANPSGNVCIYAEMTQTGGASVAGSMTEFLVNFLEGNSSETEGQYGAQYQSLQGATGAITRQIGLSVICGGSPISGAVALGTVGSARGVEAIIDARADVGSTVAYTEAMGLYVLAAQADATHTIGTIYGLRIEDQGAAVGIATKYGIKVEAQTGGIGIWNRSSMKEDSYFDIGPIAAPANPAAGYWRMYNDTADGTLKARNSAGTIRNIAVP